MKKILAFDLDDTLAVAKSPITDEMGDVLGRTLDHFDVCIISGGRYEQFMIQVIERLQLDKQRLARLHLMPTCGTQYYLYKENSWQQQYAELLTEAEKTAAFQALEQAARELNLWEEEPWGEVIEDRESQITLSALGQKAPSDAKYAWDPDGSKKLRLQQKVQELLPELEVRAGGTTSIDVTRIGIDKAYGMKKLIEATGFNKEDILFFGDKLGEGGNDYPVKALGIDCLEVEKWQDTAGRLEAILHVI